MIRPPPRSPFAVSANILEAVVKRALSTVGVEEVPRGSNAGPEVTAWLKRVGITQPSAWCAAWVWCMFDDGARDLGIVNPCPKTAGALKLWNRAPVGAGISASLARETPTLIKRGSVFVEDHGHGLGHVGLVLAPPDATGMLQTVEANTVPKGQRSRNGYAVALQSMRLDDLRLVGFIDFGKH